MNNYCFRVLDGKSSGGLWPLNGTKSRVRLTHHRGSLGHGDGIMVLQPHLTLGRVKSPANREKLARLLAKLPPVDWPPFEVKELILFQSVLSPKGSKYTPLKVIPLG
jgi:hypothetical protein